MSDLVQRLRFPGTVFYEYAVDGGALLREAADRIEALETEKNTIAEHATALLMAGCAKHDDVVRGMSFPEFQAAITGHTCALCNKAEVERLRVDLGRARARPYLRTPIAWTSEDGDLCVLGTHDRKRAHEAVMAYVEETGCGGDDDEWDAWASNPATIANGERLFVDPLVVEDEDWPRTSLSAEPHKAGWLPYLFARYP